MYQTKNIVENAVNSKDHTTLVAAVKAADLVGTLQGPGPFTVFAPTNAAFDKLPAGTVETLVKPENKGTLASILTYHVVPGTLDTRTLRADIAAGGGKAELSTVNGEKLTLTGMGTTSASPMPRATPPISRSPMSASRTASSTSSIRCCCRKSKTCPPSPSGGGPGWGRYRSRDNAQRVHCPGETGMIGCVLRIGFRHLLAQGAGLVRHQWFLRRLVDDLFGIGPRIERIEATVRRCDCRSWESVPEG